MSVIEGLASAAAGFQNTGVTKVEPTKHEAALTTPKALEEAGSIAKEMITVTQKEGTDKEGDNKERGEENKAPSQEKMKKAVEDLNKRMPHTSCQFSVHDATNRIMIKIVDKETKEVVKEVPPEKTLDLIEKAWELAGVLVDEKL